MKLSGMLLNIYIYIYNCLLCFFYYRDPPREVGAKLGRSWGKVGGKVGAKSGQHFLAVDVVTNKKWS